jgi:hypothetical protein
MAGLSCSAPRSSARCWRCWRFASGTRSLPIDSLKACGASIPRPARRTWCSSTCLRRLLGGNGAEIVTHGRGCELRLVDGDIDAVQFERLLDKARPREALALWRGEALADLVDEPFAAAEIQRRTR